MNNDEFKRCFPFPEERDGQRDIIERVLRYYDQGYDNVILCAPTAVGKSAIAVTIAKYLGDAYLLTSQKQLQEQYMNDFEKDGMALVKGKYNYTCARNSKLKCDAGECLKEGRRGKKPKKCCDCPYYMARDHAYDSQIAVFNYAYFLNMTRSGFEKHLPRELLILDEAHNCEGAVLEFHTVKLDVEDFKKFEVKGVVHLPDENLSDKQKFDWLYSKAKPALYNRYAQELSVFENMNKNHTQYYNQSRRVSYLDTLVCMINRLGEVKDTPGVVIQNSSHDITFKPLRVNKCSDMLMKYGTKVLAMSATIFDKDQFCEDLALDPMKTAFVSCDSPIPAENRPVFNIGSIDLSYKNKEKNLPKLKTLVEKILDAHAGQRGIIHTTNYSVAKYLIENIDTDRLVMPRGKTREAEIDRFKTSKQGDLVLISPSLSEGISLDDDLSRFTIVCKLPYGNLGDPWVKKRMQLSQKWYDNETIQTLVQMTGRSVRSKDDEAIAYILDHSFSWFYKRNSSRFPDWWKVSLVEA